MKKSLCYSLFFFIILITFNSCLNDNNKNINSKKEKDSNTIKEYELDNAVISQTIQSIIDSLDNLIRINLKEDYLKYKFINVYDSLYDIGLDSSLFLKAGINKDSMKCNKNGGTKLEILNKSLKGGKEIRFVSSQKEYYELKQQNFANRVLISFSQVYFNKRYDVGLFNLWFSCSSNAGLGYAIYVIKEDNKWILKKIFVSYIR